jgi:hypothetical protein
LARYVRLRPGVKNIDLGIGKLWVAYLGGLDDDIASPDTGSFYKHSLDIRLKDIQIGPGKLMLVLIGNYEKGTTFTKDFNGNLLAAGDAILTHPVRTDDAYGIGGGAAYHIDLNAIGPKSYLEVYGLAGWGATNFSTSTDLGVLTGFVNSALVKNPATQLVPSSTPEKQSKNSVDSERADFLCGIRILASR